MTNALLPDLNHVLRHTPEVWDDLRNGHLFLTGGTGFFGCWLLESFLHANDQLDLRASVTVLTRDGEAFRAKAPHLAQHSALTLWNGDVRSFAFPQDEYTHVLHVATDTDAARNKANPLAMADTIVEGTRRVLDFAVACGARSFLLTSSGAVYGPQPPELSHVPETYRGGPDQTQAQWSYGESKRMAELLCCLYGERHGLPVKIARCFAFVGPYLRLDGHFAIGNFIQDVMAGRAIQIRGDGTPLRSYLYAADLAIWLWTMLVKAPSARPYNVGSEEALSIAQVARAVVEALGVRTEIQIAGVPNEAKLAERYVPSVARAREELGLSQSITVDDAIRRTAAWHEVLVH